VLGEPLTHIFPVVIATTKIVGLLKDTIKEKKHPAFDHIPADTLVLWKVSLPFDVSLEETMRNFDGGESLSPVEALSEVFPSTPARKHLHIVVKPPPVGES
jgi:Crinkler effector protein N-terminal domain